MLVAVVGGNLQGVEAAYLAQKAGWDVLLFDRKAAPPATDLCQRFIRFDVTSVQKTAELLGHADLVLPALENQKALDVLSTCAASGEIALAFDPDAYAVTASKIQSNTLFDRLGILTPGQWPDCGFPMVVKPDCASGSQGVRVVHHRDKLPDDYDKPGKYVLQKFTPGPSYSLEVVGTPGRYQPLQVTTLEMDAVFDCKRVLAPANLSLHLTKSFERMAVKLAESIRLRGVMDVEVILDGQALAVLEIDARLPSQTPTTVYWSTGVNMVAQLEAVFSGRDNLLAMPDIKRLHSVIYEHIHVSNSKMEVGGEHLMSNVDPLHIRQDFFGADEALTNYRSGRESWVATLIFSESDQHNVTQKRNTTIEAIKRHCDVDTYLDPGPSMGINQGN